MHHDGEYMGFKEVRDLNAKDAVLLPYLGNLLVEVLSKQRSKFAPTQVLKVSLPKDIEIQHIMQGHWDVVSHMTSYEGIRSLEFIVEDSYALDSLEDMKKLADEGFFICGGSFFIYHGNNKGYEAWLIENNQAELYMTLLEDEEMALQANPIVLLNLVGKYDWKQFMYAIQKFDMDLSEYPNLIEEMCSPYPTHRWSIDQFKDILPLVEVPLYRLGPLIHQAAGQNHFELFKLLITKATTTHIDAPSLKWITSLIKKLLLDPPARVNEFLHFCLDLIESKYKTFYDDEILLMLAAQEERQELLKRILRLIPDEQWHNPVLFSYALATENEMLHEQLNFSREEIIAFMKDQIDIAKDITKKEQKKYILDVFKEGNYFQGEYFASRLRVNELIPPMLETCKAGFLGLVRLLIQEGKVPVDCDANFPIKCANQKKYTKLKAYLLSKGVMNEEFELPYENEEV